MIQLFNGSSLGRAASQPQKGWEKLAKPLPGAGTG